LNSILNLTTAKAIGLMILRADKAHRNSNTWTLPAPRNHEAIGASIRSGSVGELSGGCRAGSELHGICERHRLWRDAL